MREQILTLILLAIAAPTSHAQNNEPSQPPIIDVHMHVYDKDERLTHKVPNPVTGQPLSATTGQAHMQATLAEMKKYNIVKAVVSNEYEVSLPIMVQLNVQRVPLRGFGEPSVSRSFNQLPLIVPLSRQRPQVQTIGNQPVTRTITIQTRTVQRLLAHPGRRWLQQSSLLAARGNHRV
jgi:hypothetical protein